MQISSPPQSPVTLPYSCAIAALAADISTACSWLVRATLLPELDSNLLAISISLSVVPNYLVKDSIACVAFCIISLTADVRLSCFYIEKEATQPA